MSRPSETQTCKFRRADVKELLSYWSGEQRIWPLVRWKNLRREAKKKPRTCRRLSKRSRKRISEAIKKYETDTQLVLSFKDPMEVSQLEGRPPPLEKRLKASEEELRREPGRIRESYVVKARRIEPVGLVYLWPISG